MYMSMQFRDMLGVRFGDSNIQYVASDTPAEAEAIPEEPDPVAEADTVKGVKAFTVDTTAGGIDDIAKVASSGIILVGSGENVRALMGFFGTERGGAKYAETVSLYGAAFGRSVNVYCMPIPTSTEYYCPEEASKFTKKQWPVFNSIFSHLTNGVKAVDVYTVLGQHVDEPIYLRTDHHWAPLGAYYAAQKFAEVAGVPFADLSTYEEHVVHRYVGSMYGYSQNVAVKKAPEDFVYYIPTGVEYSTTYVNYTLDEEFHVTGESKPYQSKYFFSFKDGSGAAYTTFMGGDIKMTKVVTSTHNGRRLLVIKDSFGNAVPGYLFHSFEEIHVADFRYFTKDVVSYVDENRITDILFANNITNTCVNYTYSRYRKFLNPSDPGLSAFHADTIPTAVKQRMIGNSYPEEGAEIELSELRYLKLLYYDYNGRVRHGEMVCNKAIAADRRPDRHFQGALQSEIPPGQRPADRRFRRRRRTLDGGQQQFLLQLPASHELVDETVGARPRHGRRHKSFTEPLCERRGGPARKRAGVCRPLGRLPAQDYGRRPLLQAFPGPRLPVGRGLEFREGLSAF